jgi:hypothetical protein
MKPGAENRKKTVLLGVLGAILCSGVLYNLYSFFGPSGTPPPSIAPLTNAPTPPRAGSVNTTNARTGSNGLGAVPGVAAQKIASTSAGLDPTLDEAAMLRTESLVYAGSGRNIFSANYTPVAAFQPPAHVPSARPNPHPGPVVPIAPVGPPPPPPIPLKFFGTAQRRRGLKQVFLLSGDDVYLASAGDIVAKRFKVVQILPNAVQITDLLSNNTQMLPMQQ